MLTSVHIFSIATGIFVSKPLITGGKMIGNLLDNLNVEQHNDN